MSEITGKVKAAIADRYRIERELGSGGMATVYLAHDVKHDRKVALKVLRPELAAVIGAERFLQEIKVTANLHHPNILALYDSGEVDTFLYYVMPFVEGESLRDRLEREQQLPIDDAIELTRGVAAALHYAHKQGVIHRDIKPENILLHDGRPMVADFGIALAISSAGADRLTETGLSLGTPHYMSPEQSTGNREIDARSDVYSLGVMLYEMLAGEPPFTGPNAQAIVAKVITEKAPLVSLARDTVPRHVALAVYRALNKLPADRWPTAMAFSEALVRPRTADTDAYPLPAGETLGGSPAAVGPSGWRTWATDPRSVGLAVVAVGAIAAAVLRGGAASAPLEPVSASFGIALPAGESFAGEAPAVSPDGRTVVYVVRDSTGQRLRARVLDAFESRTIEGTEGARRPFFSRDGTQVGFWVGGNQVGVVPVTGGRALVVGTLPIWSDIPLWLPDGRILVGERGSGLRSLAQGGRDEEPVTFLDTAQRERAHLYPLLLPNGRLLFSVLTDSGFGLATQAEGATSHQRIPLVLDGPADYVEPGVLVFRMAGRSHAVLFDPLAARVRGTPAPIEDALAPRYGNWRRAPAIGAGTVAFTDIADAGDARLTWVDRSGRRTPVEGIRGELRWVRLSPDGSRVATGGVGGGLDGQDIWVIHLASRTRVRLVTPGRFSTEPVWTRDGARVAYSHDADPFSLLAWQAADGSGQSERLHAAPFETWPTDWSPDGTELLFYGTGGAPNVDDMFVVDLEGNRRTVVAAPGDQRGGRFSPDGRWIAYQSSETGRYEVYVQPYPSLDRKWAVSVGGGIEPVWAPDGRELFFRNDDRLMAVSVARDSVFVAGPPREIFRDMWYDDPGGDQTYDVSPDGRRFLTIDPGPASAVELRVIVNVGERLVRLLREREGESHE